MTHWQLSLRTWEDFNGLENLKESYYLVHLCLQIEVSDYTDKELIKFIYEPVFGHKTNKVIISFLFNRITCKEGQKKAVDISW